MSNSNSIVSGDSTAANATTKARDAAVPKAATTISMTSTTPSPTPQLSPSDSTTPSSIKPQLLSPSPLHVGTRFVKQYYKTLSSTPDQIVRFYEPSSLLSVGVGSATSTQPITLEQLTAAIDGEKLKDRFFPKNDNDNVEWTPDECLIRFEFEHGAIDAQQSINNTILLVVTGHIVYLKQQQNDEQSQMLIARKAFVHTFFLCSTMAGSKVSYYVHNDILRFLHLPEQTKEEYAVPKTLELPSGMMPAEETAAIEANKDKEDIVLTKSKKKHGPKQQKHKQPLEKVHDDITASSDNNKKEVVSSNGVVAKEETKILQTTAKKSKQELSKKKSNAGQKTTAADSRDQKDMSSPRTKAWTGATAKKESNVKPDSSSWPSLMATQSVPSATPTRTLILTSDAPSPSQSPQMTVSTEKASDATTVTSTSNHSRKQKQPLVKKQVDSPKTQTTPKENGKHDSSMKQENQENQTKRGRAGGGAGNTTPSTSPKAAATTTAHTTNTSNAKRNPDSTLIIRNVPSNTIEKELLDLLQAKKPSLIGCTILARGTAFVDYNSSDPVFKVLAIHDKTPFLLKGQKLDIHQKSNDPHQHQSQSQQRQQQQAQPQPQQQNKINNSRRRNSSSGRGGGNKGREDSGDRSKNKTSASKVKSPGDEKHGSNQNLESSSTQNMIGTKSVEKSDQAEKSKAKNNERGVNKDRQQPFRNHNRGGGEGRQGVRGEQ